MVHHTTIALTLVFFGVLDLCQALIYKPTDKLITAGLMDWKIQKEERVEINATVFNECDITTRCIALPRGCLQSGTCTAFVEIYAPREVSSPFLFQMYLLKPEERAFENPRYWIALGFNKQGQRMSGANVMICFWANDARGQRADGVFYGWTDGQNRVVPVEEDQKRLPGGRHINNVGMTREAHDTLFKCAFTRLPDTAVLLDAVNYPELAGSTDENSTQFRLQQESIYLILAHGELDVGGDGTPLFKKHEAEDRIALDKRRIAISFCLVYAVCFGIGADGCEHATTERCNLSMILVLVPSSALRTYLVAITLTARRPSGFVGFALSRTTKSEEAISKLTYFVSCEVRADGFDLKVHNVSNCARDPGSATLVTCDGVKLEDNESPFLVPKSGGQSLVFTQKGKTAFLCNPLFDARALDKAPGLAVEKIFIWLLSGDEADFDREPGKIRLHITEEPSTTSIRTKRPKLFSEIPYSDFYVLDTGTGNLPPDENRTLGTAGDPKFAVGESSAQCGIFAFGGQIMFVVMAVMASILIHRNIYAVLA